MVERLRKATSEFPPTVSLAPEYVRLGIAVAMGFERAGRERDVPSVGSIRVGGDCPSIMAIQPFARLGPVASSVCAESRASACAPSFVKARAVARVECERVAIAQSPSTVPRPGLAPVCCHDDRPCLDPYRDVPRIGGRGSDSLHVAYEGLFRRGEPQPAPGDAAERSHLAPGIAAVSRFEEAARVSSPHIARRAGCGSRR